MALPFLSLSFPRKTRGPAVSVVLRYDCWRLPPNQALHIATPNSAYENPHSLSLSPSLYHNNNPCQCNRRRSGSPPSLSLFNFLSLPPCTLLQFEAVRHSVSHQLITGKRGRKSDRPSWALDLDLSLALAWISTSQFIHSTWIFLYAPLARISYFELVYHDTIVYPFDCYY